MPAASSALHALRATPGTCCWGCVDRALPPVLRVRSGSILFIDAITHQAGDAPDLLMDAAIADLCAAILPAERGSGAHVLTGPITVESARAGDTREGRILNSEPRLGYGTNNAAWWGYLDDQVHKERMTMYRTDAERRLARAVCAVDDTVTDRYAAPGTSIPADSAGRGPTRGTCACRRVHTWASWAWRQPSQAASTACRPDRSAGNLDHWRIGPGSTMEHPVFVDEARLFVGDPHLAEGDGERSETAIEASANAWLPLIVRRDVRLAHPLLETQTRRSAHGFDTRPLPIGAPTTSADVGFGPPG